MTAFMFRQAIGTGFGRVEKFAIALGKDADEARKSIKLDNSWQSVFEIEVSPHTYASIPKLP